MLCVGMPPAKQRLAARKKGTSCFIRVYLILKFIIAPGRQTPTMPGFYESLQGFVASPRRVAFVLVDRLAIRSQTVVAMLAPIDSLALGRGRVPLRFDVEALPVQERATILSNYGECGSLHIYALPLAACNSARLTATRASCTL